MAEEDRISSLSDDILGHILSFNTTKEAVTTSILSKRWIHLWRTIPLLNFTNIKFLDNNTNSILRFNLFVSSILLSRNTASGSHSINTFHLDVAYANSNHLQTLITPNLTTWLNFIVQLQLNHLNLHISFININSVDFESYNDARPKLSNSIFTCKTLVFLNLNCFYVKGFCFSNIEFRFPSLKTLHLTNIRFEDDENLMWLIAGCPVLEDLKVCKVFFDVEKGEYQAAERLNLSKLIRADITDCWCLFPMISLSNSEFLRIYVMEYIDVADSDVELPIFHNLTHLVINNISNELSKMLHLFPKLQNLVIYQKTETEWDMEIEEGKQSWVVPKSVPKCFSLNLRTCTIRDFALLDLQHDIMLARYILKNARVLETMTIWSDREQPEIERELSSCTRASATCQLSVY